MGDSKTSFVLTDWPCIINSNNLYFKASASQACQPCHSLEVLWPFNQDGEFPCSTFKQRRSAHVFASDRWIHLLHRFLCDNTLEALLKFTFLNISKFSAQWPSNICFQLFITNSSLLCQHGEEGSWPMLACREGDTGSGEEITGNTRKKTSGDC